MSEFDIDVEVQCTISQLPLFQQQTPGQWSMQRQIAVYFGPSSLHWLLSPDDIGM